MYNQLINKSNLTYHCPQMIRATELTALIKNSDGSWNEQPSKSFSGTLRHQQSLTERASGSIKEAMQRMTFKEHHCLYLGQCSLLQPGLEWVLDQC